MFDNVKTAVTEYQETLKVLETKLQAEFLEKLKVDCAELKAQFPALDHIFILGSTPEWNDGEECTHDSEVFVDNTEGSFWNNVSEYLERLYYDEDDYPQEFKESNKGLTAKEVENIKDILNSSKFESGLEVVYTTNYNIVIDFTGESIEVSVKEYDCGH
jgi:hypothetical protein